MYTIEIEIVDHETQIGMQRPVKSDGTKRYIRSQVITAIDYHYLLARFNALYSHKSIELQLTNGYYVRALIFN